MTGQLFEHDSEQSAILNPETRTSCSIVNPRKGRTSSMTIVEPEPSPHDYSPVLEEEEAQEEDIRANVLATIKTHMGIYEAS